MQQINLENLKSSGVYTFEHDASQTLSETSEYGRLIVGSNKVGPFNTIIQIANDSQLKSIYGPNDRSLEKKGIYFHKSIEVSLKEGPIYTMNVLKIDTVNNSETNEDCGYVSTLNTDASITLCGENIKTPIMHMFDRQKFWKANPNSIIRVKNSDTAPYKPLQKVKDNILLFANASQKTVTIFVQKSNVSGYDLTVSEWYKSMGDDAYIPEYLDEDDLISDYMVNVIAVEGDWSNYKKLASDATYSRYFNTTGLKKDKAAEFIQLKTVNVLVNVTGSLIPDFQDDRKAIISVDKLFNAYYTSSQLMCGIDVDALNEYAVSGKRMDIIGNGVFAKKDDEMINVLSYRSPMNQIITENPMNYKGGDSEEDLRKAPIIRDGYLWALDETNLYNIWSAGFLVNGDEITRSNGTSEDLCYIKIEKSIFVHGTGDTALKFDAIKITAYDDITLTHENDEFFLDKDEEESQEEFIYEFNMKTIGQGDLVKEFNLNETEVVESGSETITRQLSYEFNENVPNVIKIDVTDFINNNYENDLKNKVADASPYVGYVKSMMEYLKVNNYIKAKTSEETATRILKIMSIARKQEGSGSDAKTVLYVTTMSPTMDNVSGIEIVNDESLPEGPATIKISKGVQNFTKSLYGFKMSPYKIGENALYDNKNVATVDSFWKFVFEDSNLANAIAESEEIDIRYLVDCFAGEISNSSKYWISKLGAKHGKCLAFTNDPSFKQFEQSNDPKFIDATTGLLNTKYIADGGNLELNPSETYRFGTDTVNGMPIETFNYPCMPNLIINDGGVKRSMIPAPYVCNAFMRKFKSNAPFVIVAGVNTGKLTESDIIGVEYEFSKSDRDNLEPAGHNLIIQRRRDGIMLFSNNTAYQSVKSALNNAHVRDTLITIEKRIEKILFSFLFRYNTAVVRSRVKSLVDNYLETVKISSGIASYETQIDENNNDRYVLENNSAILDIKVDFNRGIHKFVNRVTITRAGGELSVVSSGFSEI